MVRRKILKKLGFLPNAKFKNNKEKNTNKNIEKNNIKNTEKNTNKTDTSKVLVI